MEVEFYIPIVSGIPDSLSCIPDSKAQDSGFARLWIPQAKISRITESELSYMGRNNCHFGAIRYIKKITVSYLTVPLPVVIILTSGGSVGYDDGK